jgi:hypothetical protein
MTKDNSSSSAMLQVMKDGSITPLPKTLQKRVHEMETLIISPSKYAQKTIRKEYLGNCLGP